MSIRTCRHEQAVLAAVTAGQWPAACDPALRAHAAGCRSCAETAAITQALRQAGEQARQAARLPSPGILWWRAQLRRRQQAVAQATLPVALAERVVAVVTLLGLAGALLWQRAGIAAWFLAWRRGVAANGLAQGLLDGLHSSDAGALAASLDAHWTTPLLIAALCTLAGLAGLAAYLMAERE